MFFSQYIVPNGFWNHPWLYSTDVAQFPIVPASPSLLIGMPYNKQMCQSFMMDLVQPHIHTYMHTPTPIYKHTYINAYIHTYIHTYMHACVPRTYIHTNHTHTCICSINLTMCIGEIFLILQCSHSTWNIHFFLQDTRIRIGYQNL